MTAQEVYDRLNMLGYLLGNTERKLTTCELGDSPKRNRYLELIHIQEHIADSILYIARNLHLHSSPYTPDGQKELQSLIDILDYDVGIEYIEKDGELIKKPPDIDIEAYEPVYEEYFKDIKIDGYYLCDRQAGFRVNRGYRENGRITGMRRKEDVPTDI